jgi:hypothetical protein
MKFVFAILIAVVLAACSEKKSVSYECTMNLIEQQVRLPEEAAPLDRYARYYAADADYIYAVYVKSVDRADPNFDLPVGQRRWVADHLNLPTVLDGGCSIVNVRYNRITLKVDVPVCNGDA